MNKSIFKKRMIRGLLTAAATCMLLPATALAAEDVAINETNFPDGIFREYVSENFDKDGSGTLNTEEINSVTSLNVNEKGISDLKGVEYFTAVTSLNCCTNQLTDLDVSKNTALKYLSCYENKIKELDVSNNTVLLELYCRDNELTSLDVSGCTALKRLYCQNNLLTGLDVSSNMVLEYLGCRDNVLSALDTSKNTALIQLYCNNAGLSSLDVTKNTALTYLNCSGNKLSSLDLSKNTALETLYCSNNALAELDVSNNTALIDFACKENKISSLDISRNIVLRNLECSYNQLTSLDVSKNTELVTLYFASNRLTSMDVSNHTKLEKVFYGNNSYDIVIDYEGKYDLKFLPGNFDVSKASNWVGGSVSGNILTVDADADTVTYDYDCGNERILSFKLNVIASCNHSYEVSEFRWNVDYSECDALFVCPECEYVQTVACRVTKETVKRKWLYTASCEMFDQTYSDVQMAGKYKVTEVFSDVENTWYVPYVQYVYDNELMDGTGEAVFQPNNPLTRAMFVQILYAQEGKPEPGETAPFTDLTEAWYRNAVYWAYENGVVSGKSEVSFAPNENVTREQLAVMLYAYAGKPDVGEVGLDYPDAEEISGYAVKAITWAVQNGIMSGKDVNGTLCLEPKGQASRAEAATMLMQYLEQ